MPRAFACKKGAFTIASRVFPNYNTFFKFAILSRTVALLNIKRSQRQYVDTGIEFNEITDNKRVFSASFKKK